VQDLKKSNPGQWYSKMKRMSTIDQTTDEKLLIQQFKSETNQDQAEIIADQFESISKLYKPIQSANKESQTFKTLLLTLYLKHMKSMRRLIL
jgi:hypothetical protein